VLHYNVSTSMPDTSRARRAMGLGGGLISSNASTLVSNGVLMR
jgi:hypothetical protein